MVTYQEIVSLITLLAVAKAKLTELNTNETWVYHVKTIQELVDKSVDKILSELQVQPQPQYPSYCVVSSDDEPDIINVDNIIPITTEYGRKLYGERAFLSPLAHPC